MSCVAEYREKQHAAKVSLAKVHSPFGGVCSVRASARAETAGSAVGGI